MIKLIKFVKYLCFKIGYDLMEVESYQKQKKDSTKMISKPKKVAIAASVFSVAAFSILLVQPDTFASTTATTVSSAIGSTISLLSSSGTVNINATPTSGTAVQTVASDTVTVSTNDSAGYTLKLGATGASSALTSGGNTVPTSAGTFASPVVMANNTWGYRVDGAGGFGAGPTSSASNAAVSSAKYAAIPATASPDTIKTTAATASNDTTSVWYGIAVNTSTPSGTYTSSVTYTATAN